MTQPTVDIDALAALARIAITSQEKAKLESEIPNILAFVNIIQSAEAGNAPVDTAHRNVLRDDGNPHQSGLFTERIIAQAPEASNSRIVVKQVVTRSK